MAHFVLVHGAWHGGWCWEKLQPELAARGHETSAPDLPGHGRDAADRDAVTMRDYTDRVVETVEAVSGPVVLVGHSMGGMPISAAAEAAPDRISALVYLCAFLPRDGEFLLGIEERNPRSTVPPAIEMAENGATATIPPDRHRALFYGQCDDADIARAQERLVPQPAAPFATPVRLSEARFGSVPKHYIECTEDGAISVELQRDMHGRVPGVTVHSLAADHSPFLSHPAALADILDGIAT